MPTPPSWEAIAGSPTYQRLPPELRYQLRQQWENDTAGPERFPWLDRLPPGDRGPIDAALAPRRTAGGVDLPPPAEERARILQGAESDLVDRGRLSQVGDQLVPAGQAPRTGIAGLAHLAAGGVSEFMGGMDELGEDAGAGTRAFLERHGAPGWVSKPAEFAARTTVQSLPYVAAAELAGAAGIGAGAARLASGVPGLARLAEMLPGPALRTARAAGIGGAVQPALETVRRYGEDQPTTGADIARDVASGAVGWGAGHAVLGEAAPALVRAGGRGLSRLSSMLEPGEGPSLPDVGQGPAEPPPGPATSSSRDPRIAAMLARADTARSVGDLSAEDRAMTVAGSMRARLYPDEAKARALVPSTTMRVSPSGDILPSGAVEPPSDPGSLPSSLPGEPSDAQTRFANRLRGFAADRTNTVAPSAPEGLPAPAAEMPDQAAGVPPSEAMQRVEARIRGNGQPVAPPEPAPAPVGAAEAGPEAPSVPPPPNLRAVPPPSYPRITGRLGDVEGVHTRVHLPEEPAPNLPPPDVAEALPESPPPGIPASRPQDMTPATAGTARPQSPSDALQLPAGENPWTLEDYRQANPGASDEELLSIKRIDDKLARVEPSQRQHLRAEIEGGTPFPDVESEAAGMYRRQHMRPVPAGEPTESATSSVPSPPPERRAYRGQLKEDLGPDHRHLVGVARHMPKTQFLESLTDEQRAALRDRLDVEPGDFWRNVQRGRAETPQPANQPPSTAEVPAATPEPSPLASAPAGEAVPPAPGSTEAGFSPEDVARMRADITRPTDDPTDVPHGLTAVRTQLAQARRALGHLDRAEQEGTATDPATLDRLRDYWTKRRDALTSEEGLAAQGRAVQKDLAAWRPYLPDEEHADHAVEAARWDVAHYRYLLERAEREGRVQDVTKIRGRLHSAEVAYRTEMEGAASTPFAERPHATPPPGPVTAPAPEDLARRSDIVRDLAEKLDVPIRTGRLGPVRKTVLGLFKKPGEVIRTRLANDIPTIAHEVGHLLETRAGFDQATLQPFSDELLPIATESRRKGGELSEGFAEFLSRYIADPAAALRQTPRFLAHFDETVGKTPALRDTLLAARQTYQRWLDQPPVARVLSQISRDPTAAPARTWHDYYTAVVDQFHPAQVAVDAARRGEEGPASENPYILMRVFQGVVGKVDHFLQRGPFRYADLREVKGIKPLSEILAVVGGDRDAATAYVVSRRVIEKAGQGKETGIVPEDARNAVTQLESPVLRGLAEDAYKYQDALLQYIADSGVMSNASLDRIRPMNRDFVPFHRVIEDARPGPSGSGTTFGNLFNPVRAMKGSGRDIIDPWESMVKNTYALINVAERNRVALAIDKLADLPGAGKWVERLPTPVKPVTASKGDVLAAVGKPLGLTGGNIETALSEQGIATELLPDELRVAFQPSRIVPTDEPILAVFKDGKPQLLRLDPALHRAALSLDRESVNTVIRLLSKPAHWLRSGATLTPEFILRNPVRDQATAWMNTKYGFTPGVDFIRGLFHVLKRDDLYWEFQRSGAAQATLAALDRTYMQGKLEEMIPSTGPAAEAWRHPLKALLSPLRALSEAGEMGTRLGEFGKAIAKEGRSLEGMTRAAMAAREVTVDFARRGAKVQAINMMSAFWSARIQGTDRLVRSFIENNPRATTVAATMATASMFLWWANRGDKRVQDLPQWERDLFWIVPVGDTLWRVPKSFEQGILFASFPERILDTLAGTHPHVMQQWADHFFSGVYPGGGAPLKVGGISLPLPFLPTAAVPVVENLANWSLFTDRPIVPRGQEELEPGMQSSPSTPAVLRRLGEAVNFSPSKIENLVRGWTGGLGVLGVEGLDSLLAHAVGIDEPGGPSSTAADAPGLRGFVARWPTTQAQSVEDFYQRQQQAAQATASYHALTKSNPEKAGTYADAHEQELSEAKYLNRVAQELSRYRAVLRGIYADPSMSAAEKRSASDTLTGEIIDIARETLRALEPEPTPQQSRVRRLLAGGGTP